MNEITLANRVQRVKPSPTLSITARVGELRAAGQDIIGLGAGEPDFDTPEHIKAAAIEAIHSGFTRYTAVDGTPELKKAIIAKFRRDNGLDYTPGQILVSCGGKQSFYNLCQSLLNHGDELQDLAGAAGIRHHRPYPAGRDQQPVQSHRRRLHTG